MKKFLHSHDDTAKGLALIVVLAFVVLATVLGLAYFAAAQTPTPTPGCVFLVSAQIVNPGSSYVVDDILDPVSGTLCPPASNYGFRLRVDSVDSVGHVTAVSIIPGIGYSGLPPNPVGFGGSATGTGFTANCTFH